MVAAMCPDTFSEKIGVVKPPPLSHSILVHLHTRGNRIKNCFPPPLSNYRRGNLLGYDDFFHSNDSTPPRSIECVSLVEERGWTRRGVNKERIFNAKQTRRERVLSWKKKKKKRKSGRFKTCLLLSR